MIGWFAVARLEMVHRGLPLCLAIALASGVASALAPGEARADGAFSDLARRLAGRLDHPAGPPPHFLPPPVNLPAPRVPVRSAAAWPPPPEVPDWTREGPRPVWIAARARIAPAGPGEPLGPLPEHPVIDRPSPVWLNAR